MGPTGVSAEKLTQGAGECWGINLLHPCVFALHELATDACRRALLAWRARHPGASSAAA